jgi:hypothetical protein
MLKCRQTVWQHVVLAAVLSQLAGCGGGSADPGSPSTNTAAALTESLVGPTNPSSLQANTPSNSKAVELSEMAAKAAAVKEFQRTQQRIGANLNNVRGYAKTHEFVDIVMAAEGLGSPSVFGSGDAILGADGWPVGDFSVTPFMAQRTTTGLGGVYKVVFKGQATVTLAASDGTLGTPTYDAQTGKTVIDLTLPEGVNQLCLVFRLKRDATGAAIQSVKDLQIIRPGYDWRNPPLFTTTFLNHLSKFSTLRFMDWLQINVETGASYDLPDGSWAARPTPTNKRVAAGTNVPRGQPWERVVALVNQAKVDPWINVPPTADDNYYTQLARFMKNGLQHNQRIYVEYGNEMWNGGFKQTERIGADAVAEVKANSVLGRRLSTGLFFGVDANGKVWTADDHKVELGQRLYIDRLVRISEAFRAEFGDAAMMSRVRPVLAWQLANPAIVERMLKFATTVYPKAPSHYFWAIAGGNYFSMTGADISRAKSLYQQAVQAGLQNSGDLSAYSLSVDEIIASMNQNIDEGWGLYWMERNYALARRNGLQWVAYEGGPDTFGIESADNKAKANRDPRMFGMCKRMLETWSNAGGGLFMWFTAGASKWNTAFGSWTLVEDMSETTNPKLECMEWASTTPAGVPLGRHVLPTTFSAGETIKESGAVANQTADTAADKLWYAKDQVRSYIVSSPVEACYKLSIEFTNTSWSGTTSVIPIEIDLNDNKVLSPPNAAIGPGKTAFVDFGKVCMSPGIHVLVARSTAGGALTAGRISFTNWN